MKDIFLSARWENLIMANYAIDPDILKPFLPNGVVLDMYHGKTYVSLVGFMFKKTRLFGLPIPLMGTFEEINLRFYVKRTEGDSEKRGVVFINESVPYKIVAWVANRFYHEHYISIPARNETESGEAFKRIRYEWKKNKQWNHIEVKTLHTNESTLPGSIEEFIYEHYYGYTKVNDRQTQEYKVNHPVWQVNKVMEHSIRCDFSAMYGSSFSSLSDKQPDSVLMAVGSPVTVAWKRSTF